MAGYRDGEQWADPDGTIHTVNSTNDPRAPGGYYHTQKDPGVDGPDGKATAVFNPDGSFADVPNNNNPNNWKPSPRD